MEKQDEVENLDIAEMLDRSIDYSNKVAREAAE
jgi:hypothetical protein